MFSIPSRDLVLLFYETVVLCCSVVDRCTSSGNEILQTEPWKHLKESKCLLDSVCESESFIFPIGSM